MPKKKVCPVCGAKGDCVRIIEQESVLAHVKIHFVYIICSTCQRNAGTQFFSGLPIDVVNDFINNLHIMEMGMFTHIEKVLSNFNEIEIDSWNPQKVYTYIQ
jgi:transcription elongation factor Elf1